MVIERAHAKVNLWLEIPARRDDGYHEIETVMHEIDLHDEVRIERAATTGLASLADGIPLDESNLALRALRALEKAVGRELPCRIELVKNIPAGGGLGGGSSDAAAVLRGAARVHGLDVDEAFLERVAATYGSDTAFFVRGGTAVCRGRGELLEPLAFDRALDLVLAFPPLSVPTGPVFGALRVPTGGRPLGPFLEILEQGNAARIREAGFNRLDEPACALHPELAALHEILADDGFLLSGSGSTLFRICDDAAEARRLAAGTAVGSGVRMLPTRSARRGVTGDAR